MTDQETVTAVYENGILRPVRPLNLRERQTVYIQILPQEAEASPDAETETEKEMESIIQSLIQAGALTSPPGHSEVEPLSKDERIELARELGRASGKPLSEIIVEDRGEW